MKTYKTRGLVLREYEAGEADKRLSLLCKAKGRINVYARGARKPKSKFVAAAQLLCYADYVLAEGSGFTSVTQATIIESFYPIRQDYERLRHAAYILEICEKTIPVANHSSAGESSISSDELLLLTLKALQHISGDVISPRQALCVFMFRFFLYSGLKPELACCCMCEFTQAAIFCDEGLLCESCKRATKKARMPISAAALAAMQHIYDEIPAKAFLFNCADSVLDELAKAAKLCWLGHFQFPLQVDVL